MLKLADRSRTPLLRRIVAIGVTALLLATLPGLTLAVALPLWYAFLVVQMFVFRRTTALGLLFFSLTLYGTTAWLALELGNLYFAPWPSRSIVASATLEDFTAILVAYIGAELLFGAELVQRAMTRSADALRARFTAVQSTGADFVASIVLLGIGTFDTIRIFSIGIGSVVGGSRREFASQLLLGGDHNVQVVAMAATIYLISRAAVGRGRLNGFILTAFAWTPFLLVGSRKEAIVTTVICLFLWNGLLRPWQRLLLILGGVLAFVSPAIKTGVPYDALHEFILPQYMHFSIAMGLVPSGLGGTFAERVFFLLPSALRPFKLEDFGQAFYSLGLTGVGIGASPFGEAALNDFWGSTVLSFAVVFLGAIAIIVFSARRAPTLAVVAYGLLAVYGRSDFWTFAFFAVYIAIALSLFIAAGGRSRRARARDAARGPTQDMLDAPAADEERATAPVGARSLDRRDPSLVEEGR